ncbi:MAG: ABC transporter ATP-binding protein [Clostridiales Family XIII bacterium]|nr:ABC transporter ATP-binding protein [Clostridiales Family XIII bacterium]
MLKITGMSFKYGKVEVLHGISINAEKGKITSLIGANGAGKTTTMKAIMGLMPISGGTIEWDGTTLSGKDPSDVAKCGVALCPEGRQLFPNMSVYENLLMGAYTRKDKEEIKETIESVYQWFPRLVDRRNQMAGTLSGGEQEMLAISRALMSKPSLMLMDEPSWGLAPILVEEVGEIIKSINAQGTTVLLVEQNAQMALDLADYVYVLETGKIVLEGAGAEVSANEEIQQAYLGV